jgi:hypothetical protein
MVVPPSRTTPTSPRFIAGGQARGEGLHAISRTSTRSLSIPGGGPARSRASRPPGLCIRFGCRKETTGTKVAARAKEPVRGIRMAHAVVPAGRRKTQSLIEASYLSSIQVNDSELP